MVVAIHYCTGTGQGYYSNSPYAQLAETHGFIVIYPSSPYSGTCWDVSSVASETHGGGADTSSIANMVSYTLATYGADKARVFVTGSSSGAMMTNVLAAAYPDVFAAATVYSGVPAGCFYTGTTNGWNNSCAQGQSVHTQAQWATTALNMYPGYTGTRPKMLIFHGSADTTLYPAVRISILTTLRLRCIFRRGNILTLTHGSQNFNETIKQWTGVFNYSLSPVQTLSSTPSSAYTKTVYGTGDVVGIYGQGIGHTVPIMGDQDLAWFGIS